MPDECTFGLFAASQTTNDAVLSTIYLPALIVALCTFVYAHRSKSTLPIVAWCIIAVVAFGAWAFAVTQGIGVMVQCEHGSLTLAELFYLLSFAFAAGTGFVFLTNQPTLADCHAENQCHRYNAWFAFGFLAVAILLSMLAAIIAFVYVA